MPHAHGVDLAHWERGSGPAVLYLHETGTGAEIWRPLAEAIGDEARSISYDRRGWGRSEVPAAYARTTVEEQSEDAAALLDVLGADRALLCGSGLGAVAALDLLLRHPALVAGAVLIEPPLLAFVREATEGLSADRAAIEEALRDGGPGAALDLYLTGGLPFLGPGAERIPAEAAQRRPRATAQPLRRARGGPGLVAAPGRAGRGRGADPDRRLGLHPRAASRGGRAA